MRYQSKPSEVEAMRYTGDNVGEIREWAFNLLPSRDWMRTSSELVEVLSSNGWVALDPGSYAVIPVSAISGETRPEVYPCTAEVFERRYEVKS